MPNFDMSSDYLSEMMQKAKKADIKEATPEQKEEETVKEVRAEDLEKLKQITDKKIPELEIGVNTEKNEVEKELATKRKVELKAYGKTKCS